MGNYFTQTLRGITELFTNITDNWPKILIFLTLLAILIIPSYVYDKRGQKMIEGTKKFWLTNRFRWLMVVCFIFIVASYGQYMAYKNKIPNFATPSELSSPVLSGLNIRVTDLVPVYSEPIVSGKVFDNCTFYGPAVWSLRDNNRQNGEIAVIAEGGVTADTVIISTDNPQYVGVIIFDSCIFKGITKLHNISIISNSPDQVNQMRESLRESLNELNLNK